MTFFGLLWPSFSAPSSPGVAQKCPTTVPPCYTYGNPCPNIRGGCSINFMQFLNTPTSETASALFSNIPGIVCLIKRRILASPALLCRSVERRRQKVSTRRRSIWRFHARAISSNLQTLVASPPDFLIRLLIQLVGGCQK